MFYVISGSFLVGRYFIYLKVKADVSIDSNLNLTRYDFYVEVACTNREYQKKRGVSFDPLL